MSKIFNTKKDDGLKAIPPKKEKESQKKVRRIASEKRNPEKIPPLVKRKLERITGTEKYWHRKDLQTAINDLKLFAECNKTTPASLIHSFDIMDDGPLLSKPKGHFKIALTLLSSIFSKKARANQLRKRDLIQARLSKSIKYILNVSPLNDSFATLAHPVVELFNEAIKTKRREKRKLFWALLLQKHGLAMQVDPNPILLPRVAHLQYNSIDILDNYVGLTSTETVSALAFSETKESHRNDATLFNIQQSDALYMKAITTLKETEFAHILQTGKHSPLHTTIKVSANDYTIGQVFIPFPGEIVALRGNFKKHQATGNTLQRFFLDNQSVQVAAVSKQEGFPHPTQHTGFALTHHLIAHPYSLEKLPKLQALLKEKNAVAHALLPHGYVNQNAKKLLRLKKAAFIEKKDFYLSLHHTLSLTILKASAADNLQNLNSKIKNTIDDFYSLLEKQHPESLYTYLGDLHQKINECFIVIPFVQLHEQGLTDNSYLLQTDPVHRFHACHSLFMQYLELNQEAVIEQQTRASNAMQALSLEYIAIMGPILGQAACRIALQQFSEKLDFLPPNLSSFDKKLQECLYEQLNAFIRDLRHCPQLLSIKENTLEVMHTLLKSQIEREIDIFNGKGYSSSRIIVDELSAYYTEVTSKVGF